MTWLDNLVCSLVDQAAIQSAPDDAKIKIATVSDPPVLTPGDLVRIDEESRALGAAFRDRTRIMDGGRLDVCERCQRWTDRPALPDLGAHLAAVLKLVRRTGGYMSAEDQDVIRAAREAVR